MPPQPPRFMTSSKSHAQALSRDDPAPRENGPSAPDAPGFPDSSPASRKIQGLPELRLSPCETSPPPGYVRSTTSQKSRHRGKWGLPKNVDVIRLHACRLRPISRCFRALGEPLCFCICRNVRRFNQLRYAANQILGTFAPIDAPSASESTYRYPPVREGPCDPVPL